MSLGRSRRKQMEKAPTIYSVLCNIEMVGDGYTPNVQTYDSFGPTYDPDYTIGGLDLFPRCTLIDPDSPIASIGVNGKLESFEWLEVTSGGTTPIYSSGTTAAGYSVVKEGDMKGKLTVMKNGIVGVARAVRFIGHYSEDGQRYRFESTMKLTVSDVSSPGVELMIDSDKAVTYNPLRMPREQTIVAKAMKGDKDITTDERCKLMWYRRDENGRETPLTAADDYDNIEVVSSVKTGNGSISSLTIDRELIGDGITYAVYAIYRADKNFPASPEALDARQYTTITRSFPQVQVDILGDGINSNTDTQRFKALVKDNQGVIDNWNEYMHASWKVGDGNSETEVARGVEVMLPLSFGKSVFCDIEPRGANQVLISDSGEYMTDSDGAVIICRDYDGD